MAARVPRPGRRSGAGGGTAALAGTAGTAALEGMVA